MMQVGGDGIRPEALLEAAHGLTEPEAAGTVADVKMHAAGALGKHVGLHLALFVHQRELLREHVRVHVAGAQMRQNFRIRAFARDRDAVDHDDLAAAIRRFQRAVDGSPDRVLRVGRLGPVMRALDTDDDVGIFFRNGGGDARVNIRDGLLGLGIVHALGGNIDEGKHTHLRRVDDMLLKIAEVAPAGRARVHRGGHAAAGHMLFRVGGAQRIVIRIREHREDMTMHIDQARRDDAVGHIHHRRRIGRKVFAAGGDHAVLHRNVLLLDFARPGIVYLAALQENVKLCHLSLPPPCCDKRR